MTELSLEQQIAQLRAENAELKARPVVKVKADTAVHFKVSPKGAVSIYGLGSRWPVTLYKSQANRMIKAIGELEKFIQLNDASLKAKEEIVAVVG